MNKRGGSGVGRVGFSTSPCERVRRCASNGFCLLVVGVPKTIGKCATAGLAPPVSLHRLDPIHVLDTPPRAAARQRRPVCISGSDASSLSRELSDAAHGLAGDLAADRRS